MSDAELIAWLESGAQPALSLEEETARRRGAFSLRFAEALTPLHDLGPTEEAHEAAVARNVYEVHRELNALGDAEYSAVWRTIPASYRAAIKVYISMAAGASTP